MADTDDPGAEASVSSYIRETLESSQNGESVSTEDIAWADSCLAQDPEVSDREWSSVKDSLLEMLSVIPEARDLSSGDAMNDSFFVEGTDVEMLPTDDESAVNEPEPSTVNYRYPVTIGGETVDEIDLSILSKDELDVLSSLSFISQGPEAFDGDWNSLRDAVDRILSLRPNSQNPTRGLLKESDEETTNGDGSEGEFQRVLKDGLLPAERSPSTQESEQPGNGDIFKVWDLCIPDEEDEEDEFIQKLNKALAGGPVQSTADDSAAWKDIKEGALDYLIAGIGDLSIQHDS